MLNPIFLVVYVISLIVSFGISIMMMRQFQDWHSGYFSVFFMASFVPYANSILAVGLVIYFCIFGLTGYIDNYRKKLYGKFSIRNKSYEDKYYARVSALKAKKMFKDEYEITDFVNANEVLNKLNEI
jgi:hypothetical protein